ncbi:hypothetical protein ACFFQ7_05405 [Roseibacillus persicicus]
MDSHRRSRSRGQRKRLRHQALES